MIFRGDVSDIGLHRILSTSGLICDLWYVAGSEEHDRLLRIFCFGKNLWKLEREQEMPVGFRCFQDSRGDVQGYGYLGLWAK